MKQRSSKRLNAAISEKKMGNGILVICEHDEGSFKKTAYELLSKATELSASIGGPVTALVMGSGNAGDLGGYASTVLTASGEGLSRQDTGALARATHAAIAATSPAIVLAPASPIMKDMLPRVAARQDLGLGTEITALEVRDGAVVATRPMYAGKVLAEIQVSSSPALFTVRANSFPVTTPTGSGSEVQALNFELSDGDRASQVVEKETAATAVADLTEADRIVSGGRAVKSAENYDALIRPLADAVHATPGASRAAVDAHYAPHSHQVGQTGKVVNPSLYVACGISGAIQHLAGMRTSRVIVAINTDADAPIFEHATYGIVGDIFEVCPKLTAAFRSLN
jgi:electron transfer flavoprotein alpha subunit